jgi:sterol desaturase/sphingolipid hydroxylase (fatty acid hydroxylase superfamily)
MAFVETGYRNLKRYGRVGWSTAAAFVSPQMSPLMFFLDFFVYPPIIVLCLIAGMWKQPVLTSLGLAVAGYAIWTLFEYLLHRFVFHHMPFFVGLHRAHHDESLELIGTPTVYSMFFLYFTAYWPLVLMFDTQVALCLMAGFITGYISYVGVHFLVHHKGSGGYAFMRKLKRQHAVHHHGTGERNFGVTTVFWDKVFGTHQATLSKSPER